MTAAPLAAGPWRERLRALLAGYRAVLFRHPEIAKMALSTHPSGPNYMALVEAILALLHEGGVTGRPASWGMDLLLLHPTAIAVEHGVPASAAAIVVASAEKSAARREDDAERHPHLTRLGAELLSGDGGARSDWAFDVIVDGILASAARHPAGTGHHPPA